MLGTIRRIRASKQITGESLDRNKQHQRIHERNCLEMNAVRRAQAREKGIEEHGRERNDERVTAGYLRRDDDVENWAMDGVDGACCCGSGAGGVEKCQLSS